MDKSATKPVIQQTSDPDAIEKAAALLRDGKLVAFPTETVYGLGADATDERAVASVFKAKNRPQFNPLIVHVARPETALAIGVFSESATLLAERFWPGPLTLVIPRAEGCPVALLASAASTRSRSVCLHIPLPGTFWSGRVYRLLRPVRTLRDK